MRSGLMLVLLVIATGTARAGSISVEFEGILTVVQGVDGASFGTPFSGTYSYDTAAAMQSSTATSATYAGSPATGYSLLILAPTSLALSGAPLFDITIGNSASGDSLAVVANPFGTPSFRLDVSGGTDLFSSLALGVPSGLGTSASFQYTDFASPSGMVLLMGSLTSISAAVPEPATALLFALGLGALAWRRIHA